MELRSAGSAQLKLWAVALFAVGTLVSGVAWQVEQDRKAVLAAASNSIQQLVLTLEASVVGTLRSAELVAEHTGTLVRDDMGSQRQPADYTTAPWVDMLARQPFMHAIAVIEPGGAVYTSVIRTESGDIVKVEDTTDLRDWSGYKSHLGTNATGTVIATPRRNTRADQWVVPLTQALRGDDGALLAVIYVDVALDTFLSLFSDVLPPGRNAVALYTNEGQLLFSHPLRDGIIGSSFAHLSLFQSHIPGTASGAYEATDPFNQDRRTFSYRAIAGWPLILAADLSHEEILASWRERAYFYGLAAFGASLVILTLTLWLSWQYKKDDAVRRTLLLRERSLEESQRLSGVGHFERDIPTQKITWAENMYAIHGVTADSFDPGRTSFLSLVAGDVREETSKRVYHFDDPPANGHLECSIVRPSDGSVRDMVYDWEIIADEDGNPVKSFGVAQDVTDLRTSERRMRENESRLRDITECVSDFIWETDKDGVITHFESGSGELTLDIKIGVTKAENVDTSEGEGDRAFMLQAMARHEQFRNLMFGLRNAQGEVRWIRISANPRFDGDGRFAGYRGAGTDVTEQRRQRIIESIKNKNDALDRLAGGIAHEINNLLQPVVVYSSMGETEVPEPERTRGYFKKIYTATQQAVRIVQDILKFAREGRAVPVPLSLSDAIQEGLDIIRPTLPETLNLEGPGAVIGHNVQANSGGLHQVLFNLIRNAADAAGPDGHVRVETGFEVLYPNNAERWTILPGRYGFFSVTDDGPGLDEQHLSKVFDPFFTTKPRGVGTGLGLSVVAGLVREWGGAVEVQSQPGETVFKVYVPLAEAQRQAAE